MFENKPNSRKMQYQIGMCAILIKSAHGYCGNMVYGGDS